MNNIWTHSTSGVKIFTLKKKKKDENSVEEN